MKLKKKGQDDLAMSVEFMIPNGRQLNMYQYSASDGPKCYRFPADKDRLKLLFRATAGNIGELIDSLNEDTPVQRIYQSQSLCPIRRLPLPLCYLHHIRLGGHLRSLASPETTIAC